MNVNLGKKINLVILAKDQGQEDLIKVLENYLKTIAGIKEIDYQGYDNLEISSVSAVTDGLQIFLPIKDLISLQEEIEKLKKELAKLDNEILRIDKKLSNEGFVAKAPQNVIEGEKKKLEKYRLDQETIQKQFDKFQKLLQ